MNILYLIGNGFDVAQGLKTRYPDFYGSYKQTAPINDEERRIIASIDNNVEKWSDMEVALGVFTKEVNSAAGFIERQFLLTNMCHLLGRKRPQLT